VQLIWDYILEILYKTEIWQGDDINEALDLKTSSPSHPAMFVLIFNIANLNFVLM